MKENKENLGNFSTENTSVDVSNDMDTKIVVNAFSMSKSPTMVSLKIRAWARLYSISLSKEGADAKFDIFNEAIFIRAYVRFFSQVVMICPGVRATVVIRYLTIDEECVGDEYVLSRETASGG